MDGWFHQFAKVAAIVIGAALLCVGTAKALVMRYEARLSAGEVALVDVEPTLVLGVEITDAPRLTRVKMLAAALKTEVKELPWERALVRQGVGPQTLFFPVNSMRAAFALCMKLADVPPACTPTVASNQELRRITGEAVTPAVLTSIGVTPYAPTRQRTKVVQAYDAPTARTF